MDDPAARRPRAQHRRGLLRPSERLLGSRESRVDGVVHRVFVIRGRRQLAIQHPSRLLDGPRRVANVRVHRRKDGGGARRMRRLVVVDRRELPKRRFPTLGGGGSGRRRGVVVVNRARVVPAPHRSPHRRRRGIRRGIRRAVERGRVGDADDGVQRVRRGGRVRAPRGGGRVAMPPPRILPPAHRRHDRFRLLVAVLAAGALVHLDVRHLDLHLHAGERLAGEPQRSGPRPTAASATRSVLLLLVVVEEEAAAAAIAAVAAVAVAAVRRCRPRAPPSPVPDRHAASPLAEDPPPPRSRSAVGVGEGRRRPRPLRPAHARSGFVVPRALPARLAPVGRVREPDVLVVVVVEDVGHARAHAHASKLAPGVQLCTSVSVVVRVVGVVGVVEVLGAAEARVVVERGFPRGA